MSISDDIKEKVKNYLSSDPYNITEVDYVPSIEDPKLTFEKKGLSFYAVILYIDIRNSTKIIEQHHNYTVGKIHKAFMHIGTEILKQNSGEIRSFNGDSILAVFAGNKKVCENAVKTAMTIKYAVRDLCKVDFNKYHDLDFGIGIDYGKILVVKAGTPRNANNNDLIWIAKEVNNAVKIGDMGKYPFNINISPIVYENINEQLKIIHSNFIFFESENNIWKHHYSFWGDEPEYYNTEYYMNFDEEILNMED